MFLRKSITLALSLLGLFDSLYLLYAYTSPSRPMVCIGTGCDAVRASAYSSFGGVSMPVFGVLGYTLVAIVIIAESLFSARLARLARFALLGMTGLGFLFSLYLEYLQAFVIHAYCAWCMTSGIVMTALFALAIVNVVRAEPEPDPATRLAHVQSLFAVCLAGLMAGAPGFYLLTRHGELAAAPAATPASLANRLVRPGGHESGDPAAPLTVVEFGDFECPVCGRGEATARQIRAQYGRNIRFVFRQFPLERIHPFAQKAAEASECAGEQGKFWEMVEKLYSRQDDLSIEGLRRDAAELGLDQPRFHQCLTSGATAARIRLDVEDGRELGVRATPTYFIGQQRVEGVMTAEQFSQLIDGQLAGIGLTAHGANPGTSPAAAAPRKSEANDAPPRNPINQPAPTAQPAPGANRPSPDLGQHPAGIPGAALGRLGPGFAGAAPSGLFGGAQSAGAACSEAEAAKKQPAQIDTQELRHLLSDNVKPLFVDVRPASDYAAGRISGAINVAADEIGRRWDALPRDRAIILYESGRSSGDICAASRSVGRALLEHGFPFSQVKVYQDGLAGWERAGLGVDR